MIITSLCNYKYFHIMAGLAETRFYFFNTLFCLKMFKIKFINQKGYLERKLFRKKVKKTKVQI